MGDRISYFISLSTSKRFRSDSTSRKETDKLSVDAKQSIKPSSKCLAEQLGTLTSEIPGSCGNDVERVLV